MRLYSLSSITGPLEGSGRVTHVDHLLLVFGQLSLELLDKTLPVDLGHLSLGLLDLLLDLLGYPRDILVSGLLDFVNDTLEVLVLQVGEEAADTTGLRGDDAV